LHLNDYKKPIFSAARENELGQPQLAKDFSQKISDAGALLISFAEHNSASTAAFKNLYDWTSRIDMKVYQNKSIVMLSTSPGGGGGRNVLAIATSTTPHFGADLRAQLSVPSFQENFDLETNSISNPEI
jgi:chromate reductase|tara:strand:- start:18882 stop:19268 length:387 start_codon:yes stop_codon:yes gene_type:complete